MSRARLALAISAAIALPALAVPAHADELTVIYAGVLDNPTNSELNLQYALMAEGRGEYRKALAAYERILENDPNNVAAKRGLQRVRRIIQPPTTHFFAEAGVGYESNALQEPHPRGDGDVLGFLKLRMRDERTLGTTRFRTTASFFGEALSEHHDLDQAVASAEIGPIIDIPGTLWAFIPQVGGAVAYYNNSYYYSEVNLTALFESYLEGAYQWLRVRGGYRDYDSSFTSDSGFYVDVRGRFARPDIFADNDMISIAPWFRWSDIDGSAVDNVFNVLTPGKYIWTGARFEYDKVVADWLTVGVNIAVANRYYEDNRAPNGDHRDDWQVAPGATLLFNDLFGNQRDLKLDYTYIWNDSNDPAHDYDDHLVTLAIVARM